MALDQLLIDGFGPLPIEQPVSVAELGNLVRRAAANGHAVFPLGGRTMVDLGLPPSKPGIAVDLRALNQVIDYPARDMTITVQAGITIAELQNILAKEQQRLPVDVPFPERATLGGALATDASGPRRYGFGTLRDYVIGISAINDEGNEIKAGGRVVKNVAGYDLCKLFIGSLGTLGLITQVTLKVRPRPERSEVLQLHCPMQQLGPLFDRLHNSRTRPVALAASRTHGATAWQMRVGFEDNHETVGWQMGQIRRELLEADFAVEETGLANAGENTWQEIANFPAGPDPFLIRASLLPSATAACCQWVNDVLPAPHILCYPGNGIVWAAAGDPLTPEKARAMLKKVHETAAAAHGNVVVFRCPPEWKRDLAIWGQPRGDLALMKAVKDKLDPNHLFNPGRFVGGI
jgi:glycolate oxidase FAD binding subunit